MATTIDLLGTPGHLIRRAQQAHGAIWADEVGAEVTSSQFAVLNALEAAPGLDQRTLGETIGVDRSTLADLAERMVGRGLLRQERDPGDGRRRLLFVTPDGRTVHRRMLPQVARVQARLVRDLSPDEQGELIELLARLVAGAPSAR